MRSVFLIISAVWLLLDTPFTDGTSLNYVENDKAMYNSSTFEGDIMLTHEEFVMNYGEQDQDIIKSKVSNIL